MATIEATYAEVEQEGCSAPFDQAEYDRRAQALQAEARANGFDLVVLSSPDAMCWLHGYESRWYRAQSSTRWPAYQCTVFHVESGRYVHIDVEHHRHLLRRTSVAAEVSLCAADSDSAVLDHLIDQVRARGWLHGRVGLELWSHVPSPATSRVVQAAFETHGCQVGDASAVSRAVRRIKSPAEIAVIEDAARICDVGLEALRQDLRPGMTERQAWAILVSAMASAGGGPAALHESVVVGPIELGHAYSSDRVLRTGDVVCADPAGVRHRYHANIERWYVLGQEPPDELVQLAQVEARAFEILCAHAGDGVSVQTVTDQIQAHLVESGLWDYRNWNGGYELGISFPPDWVGEWTFTVGERTDDRFQAGCVTNYESIVLYPMTDTIVFGEYGARRLSRLPLDVTRAG